MAETIQVHKKEQVNFYFLMRPILIAFQLMGLLPINNLIREKKDSSKLNFSFYSYCTYYTMLFYISTISIVIYLCQGSNISSFELCFHMFAYSESMVLTLMMLLSVRPCIRLIQLLDSYDHNVSKHSIMKRYEKKVKNMYLFTFCFVFFIIFRITVHYIYFKMNDDDNIFLVLFIQSYIVAPFNLITFLFVYFCLALNSRFKLLNESLATLVHGNNLNLLLNSIEKIRLLHFHLIRCLTYLDLSFGWTMSTLYFFIIAKGLRTVFNMSYFPDYSSFYYIVDIVWNILSITITVVISDGMLTKSREVKHIIMMTRMSKMNYKFYDEVELFILQVEIKIEKNEKRKVMSLNKEILGSFTLVFVTYFITLVQFSPQIISLLQKWFNTTV